MNYFKNMLYKDGKLDYPLIILKAGFLLTALIYTIFFFIFKEFSIGGYLYPANNFFLLHLIMFLPAIACVVFAVISHSVDWGKVLWRMIVIMIVCLVITACAALIGGFKSETDSKHDYLVFDSYLSENDALDPNGEKVPEDVTPLTFEEAVKQLMPSNLDDTKSADYNYDLTSLPILGGYFDVSLKAKYNDANFSSEISRLEKQYADTQKVADEKNKHLTHYLVRANDYPDCYFYILYSVDSNKNTIYYYVCYSDRSSATPLFEQDGFDVGRIGELENDEIVVSAEPSSEVSSEASSESSSESSDDASSEA